MGEAIVGADAIMESLEAYVEVVGDPAGEIYRRFFARHHEAEDLLGKEDEYYLKGRMMDRVFGLLMDVASGSSQPKHAFYWIADHVAWEVSEAMLKDMFAVIVDVLREGVGTRWTPAMEQAWSGLMAMIMPHVEQRYAEAATIIHPGVTQREVTV